MSGSGFNSGFSPGFAPAFITCPRRVYNYSSPNVAHFDEWREERQFNARVCSCCGSLHPEEFVHAVRGYALLRPDFTYDPTVKSYKVYVGLPDAEGGVTAHKFYFWHLTPEYRTVVWDKIYATAEQRWQDERSGWGITLA